MHNPTKLKLTPLHRVSLLVLLITQYLLFFASNLMLGHYHAFPIPGLPLPSMANPNNPPETHYLHNLCLVLVFWAQHILMATLTYKLAWLRRNPYFSLYDRYVYNVASGVTLGGVIMHLKPSSYLPIFSISGWVCVPLALGGALVMLRAMKVVGRGIMMPYRLGQILNDSEVEVKSYEAKKSTDLTVKGVYGLVRHPMQAGVLLMIIFGNGHYNLERLLFVGTMVLFVVVGVLMEEKRLVVTERDYPEYMQRVRSRLIPYLF